MGLNVWGGIKQLYSRGDIRKLIAINFMQRAIKIIIQLTDALFVQKANSNFLGLISIGDIIIEVLYVISAMCLEGIAVYVSRFIGAKKIKYACKYIYK